MKSKAILTNRTGYHNLPINFFLALSAYHSLPLSLHHSLSNAQGPECVSGWKHSIQKHRPRVFFRSSQGSHRLWLTVNNVRMKISVICWFLAVFLSLLLLSQESCGSLGFSSMLWNPQCRPQFVVSVCHGSCSLEVYSWMFGFECLDLKVEVRKRPRSLYPEAEIRKLRSKSWNSEVERLSVQFVIEQVLVVAQRRPDSASVEVYSSLACDKKQNALF